jgi:AcrR family transcriptional regulator
VIVFDNLRTMADEKKPDRRINRTRQTLRDALIALILEKHYDEITVQDIINRANVGRSTFYTHFRDKEDLFRGDWERLLGAFAQHVNLPAGEGGKCVPIEGLFLHLKDFHHFYRALVKSQMTDRLFTYGSVYLAQCIEKKYAAEPPDHFKVPLPVIANYLALQVFGLLKWWLDNNMPYPPAQMDKMFHQLVTPGVSAVVADGEEMKRSGEADLHAAHSG